MPCWPTNAGPGVRSCCASWAQSRAWFSLPVNPPGSRPTKRARPPSYVSNFPAPTSAGGCSSGSGRWPAASPPARRSIWRRWPASSASAADRFATPRPTARNLARWRDPENGHVTDGRSLRRQPAAVQPQAGRDWPRRSRPTTPGTTSCCRRTGWSSCARSVNQMRVPRQGLRRVGLRPQAVHGQGAQRALRRPVGHRQDHGRRDHRRRAGAGPLQDRPLDGGQQVHRRDREEPGPHLRRGRDAQRHPLLRRGRRPLRQAHPRCATPTIATPTSRSATCCRRWRSTRASRSWPPTCARTWTRPSCGACISRSTSPSPTERDRRRIWQQIWPAEHAVDGTGRSIWTSWPSASRSRAATSATSPWPPPSWLPSDGEVVDMEHLLHATRREYQKMGKVMVDGEFGDYATQARRVR